MQLSAFFAQDQQKTRHRSAMTLIFIALLFGDGTKLLDAVELEV